MLLSLVLCFFFACVLTWRFRRTLSDDVL